MTEATYQAVQEILDKREAVLRAADDAGSVSARIGLAEVWAIRGAVLAAYLEPEHLEKTQREWGGMR